MVKKSVYLKRNEKLENKIKFACRFNNAKYEFIEGHIINIEGVNLSYIEPHKYIIRNKKYKIIVLYFDEENMFLYNRTLPIDIKKLTMILSTMKNEVQNV